MRCWARVRKGKLGKDALDMNSTSRGTSPNDPINLWEFLRMEIGRQVPPPDSDVVLIWQPGQIGDRIGHILTVAKYWESTASTEALGAESDPVYRG